MAERFSFVIVGNGIAGITAAETLRAEDASADIAVISDNPLPVYNRPVLKDFLAGRASEHTLWLRPKSFFQDHQIRFFMERVIGIQADQQSIQLQSGRHIGYHHLLLATGARAKYFTCAGANLAGVTTLRTVADYQRVLNYLGYVRRVTIIGSGPLAVETAEILHQMGYRVVHLLRSHKLWSDVLDKTASDLILQQGRHVGVDVRLEEEVAEIVGKNGHVTGVVTKKGAYIACEMVIVAIGSESVLDYVKGSGVAYGKGVKVDSSMRTNAPEIYAAGDIAEVNNTVTSHSRTTGQWYPAIQQGRAAAYSMLDILDSGRLPQSDAGGGAYVNSVTKSILYGLDFMAVGLTTPAIKSQNYQEIVEGPKSGIYRKALLKDGVLVGMLSLGECRDALAFKRAIDHCVNIVPIASHLFANEFKLTDWLDRKKIPTPILAVSKMRKATKAKSQPQPPSPHTTQKRQFMHIGIDLGQFHGQERQKVAASSEYINPYTIPIVSAPTLTESTSIKAILVPVVPSNFMVPTNIMVQEQAGKDRAPEYTVPPCSATPLSPTRILTIGREPNASLSINHYDVSRRHAEITYANGHYLLRDLGSRNGTFLNDKRLEPGKIYILNPDDQVRFGTAMVYQLQVCLTGEL